MQIATLKSEQVKLQSDGSFKSEHSGFTIEYYFWSEYGDVGFLITNNSDKDLYLNFGKSYFIYNGYAYDYYQNRIFVNSSKSSSAISSTSSQSSSFGNINNSSSNKQNINGYYNYSGAIINSNSYGTSSSNSATNKYSTFSSYSTYYENSNTIEHIEDKIACIPAHSSKYFKEFQASFAVYRECGFPRNPSKEEEVILKFTEEDSPKVFENRLMFIMNDNEIPVNHKFHVCEFQNILEDEAYEKHFRKDCKGNEIIPPVLVNKKASSDKYYIHYNYTQIQNYTKGNKRSYNDDRIIEKKKKKSSN